MCFSIGVSSARGVAIFFGKILIFDDALPQGPCTQHSLESCGALRARLRYAVHLRGTPVLAKVYCGGAE